MNIERSFSRAAWKPQTAWTTQPIWRLGLAVFFTACTTVSAAEHPLKVFILTGQSNMQGHAQVRTLKAMRLDVETAPLLTEMINDDGTPRVCEQVWISSIGSSPEERTGQLTAGYGADPNGSKIGPELTFGITMQKLVGEPILIIKTAWGGKSLHTDFRSPSAGPYPFNPSQLEALKKQGKDLDQVKAERAEATGVYYRLMRDHV
ncbi:MAG: sialate O-acetylesterase, partial [Rubripirellula sp.]|nr:sialate O-acetylesterase [Rubripirellula sp.]